MGQYWALECSSFESMTCPTNLVKCQMGKIPLILNGELQTVFTKLTNWHKNQTGIYRLKDEEINFTRPRAAQTNSLLTLKWGWGGDAPLESVGQ